MSRKGSKTSKIIMKERGNVANPVKKIKKHAGSKERVKEVLKKERDSPSKRKAKISIKCLLLEYPLFIYVYGNGAGFALAEIKEKDNYTPLCYSSTFRGILEIATNYMIKIPLEVKELSEKLDHIYNMLEARVADKKPKDIFQEYAKLKDFLEDFA